MAVAGWVLRDKTLKSGFSSNKSKKEEKDEDIVLLDASKDVRENMFEILSNICKKQGLTDVKRTAYLQTLTRLIDEWNKGNNAFFMSSEHILRCLKPGLISTNTQVKAAGFRVIRYCITKAEDVLILNKLQIPNLIARSIDVALKHDMERIQAFRLALKILILNPKHFSTAVTRSLVSLANSITEIKDRMAYSCLAILCHLCVLNPELLIECYGQTALLRCTLQVSHARINECLVGCLLFLMNKPEIRNKANIQLDYITSVYCEWEKKRPEKEPHATFKTSALSVLAALRSWTGVFQICQPNNISGIKAIVDILHLHRYEPRKAILELLYQVFGLDHELWTNEINVAVENVDPSKHQEAWNISQRFIVAEGKDILPHKIFYRPNLSEIHTALVVYTFLECGLLSALVEVIISTDAFLSVQAIILLGVILHLSYKLLPAEIIDLGPGLPTLVGYVSHGLPNQKSQALMAISALCKIHEIYKKKPTPNSLFLQKLIFYSNWYKNKELQGKPDSLRIQNFISKRGLRFELKDVNEHINESNVLTMSDPTKWNWDHIETSLKNPNDSFVRLEEGQHRTYVKKLIHFYKPSSREYSMIEYNNRTKERDVFTTTSFYLIDFLLQADEDESDKLLNDFLLDLSKELGEIVTSESLYKILLNPQHIINTMSQHYFLMVGHLSSTHKGIRALNKSLILQTLLEIVGSCRHEYYIKLIVSSLNYNNSGVTRIILSKAINSPVDSVRIYTTELLLILARIDVHNFSKWGVDLLVAQMYDENKTVAAASINILHELCYDKVYLESLLNSRPSLLHLGDKGNLLLIRFLSTHSGFILLSKANFIEPELLKWEKEFNYRYVSIIEGDLHDSLTLHQRNEDGRYSKRVSYAKYKVKDVFVYPHLYGELSKHEKGFQALVENGHIFKMTQNLQNCFCSSDLEILELKSSLWGLSNMSTSKLGFQFLDKENLFQVIVNIAHNCPVLTVRATAFYCICLISTTIAGANALAKYGWFSVRHNRSEKWPIIDQEFLLMDELSGSNLKEDESDSIPASVPYDVDETDSVSSETLKFSFDLNTFYTRSTEKTQMLSVGSLPTQTDKGQIELKNMNDQTCSENGEEKCKSSAIPVVKRCHQRSYSDTYFRRKRNSSDNSSYDGSFEGTQKFSLQDAIGLATLRTLYSNRRPVINKLSSELKDYGIRKVLLPQGESSSSPPSSSSGSLPPMTSMSSIKTLTNKFNLAYKGISLPKALAQFFIITQELVSDRKEEKKVQRREKKRRSLSFSEMEQVKEIEEESVNSSSSSDISDDDSKSGRKQDRRNRHNSGTCIGCCTKVLKEKRIRKISSGSGRHRTDTESSQGNENETTSLSLCPRLGPLNNAQGKRSGEAYGSVLGNEGNEKLDDEKGSNSEISEISGRIPPENVNRAKVKRDILKNIIRMFNPVMVKSAKDTLLQLKQAYPSAFRDVCLYSNVCNILSSSTCRFASRHFIQELFSDVIYVTVYDDAAYILQQYAPSGSEVKSWTLLSDSLSSAPQPSSPPTAENFTELRQKCDRAIQPKTVMANHLPIDSKNVSAHFENVPTTRFTNFNRECPRGQCFMDILQNSSSQVQFNFNSGDKVQSHT